MFNIVYGKAGTGKTKCVNEILASLAKKGCEDLLLIVPEQFSFSAERAMLELLGSVDCNRAEIVMSFSHIAETVRKEYGSAGLREIGNAEKILLMNMAINQVQDKITFFSRRLKSKSFVNDMILLCDEFKQNSLTPEKAAEFCDMTESVQLSQKLKEALLILESYDALLKNRFSDPFDVLTRLYEVLGEYRFFENKTVFIDGFYSFSRQELKIIERIASQAKDVYVTVCTDKIYATDEEDYDVFSYPRKTARSVINIAKRYNEKIKEIRLEKAPENSSEEIRFLEENIFRTERKASEKETKDIEIISAKNIESEAKFVALTVKKLLSEGNVRSRDIAIVSRDGGEYDIEMKEALKAYSIDVFSDKRQPVKIQPLCTYILGALEIANYGFDESRVMKCLKTGLTDLDTNEVSLLENYSLMWGKNASFLKEWTENPRGYGDELLQSDRQELEKLNRLRKIAVTPLEKFKKAFSEKVSGKKAAEEIYKLLMNTHADENLKKIAINLEEMNERELSLEQERIWKTVISVLDSFAQVVADDAKSVSEIYDLFNTIISNEEIGNIPQGLDEVLVGSAERTRVATPKIVFLVGANDGIFPKTPSSGGIFTDRERNALLGAGLDLNLPILDRIMEERFIAYHTLCTATEKIYVSYCGSSVSGELAPSEIVEEIKAIFPKCKFTDAEKTDIYDYVFSKASAFEVAAEKWKTDDEKANALKKYFSDCGDEAYTRQLEALEKYISKEKIMISDKNTAQELYGKIMHLSASRIEVFNKCPFEYFCKFGLRARPEEKAEISPRQRGTVVHYCLEKLIANYGLKKLGEMSEDELKKVISEILGEYAEIAMGGKENKTKRFSFLYAHFEKTVYELISQIVEEFSVSDFEPKGFELKIDFDGDVQPYEIPLASGGKVFVRGLVDRVDVMEKNGQKYVRVVDYKTGKKEFKLYEVLEGINMQMLIYLFAIKQNGKDIYENCIPAGVLYKPSSVSQIRTERYASKEEVEEKRKKESRYSGLVLAQEDVIYGMDREVSSQIIDVKIKDEKDNKITFVGSVATMAQLGRLKAKVDEIIERMGNELHGGRAEALPLVHGSESACDFCDYSDVCLNRDEDAKREITAAKNDVIFDFLEKEGE